MDRICSVGNCDKPSKGTRRWCSMHYERMRKHGSLDLPPRQISTCQVEGCTKKYQARGYCSMHYNRVKNHGDPHVFISRSDRAGERHGSWKGSNVKYNSMHHRLRKSRGPAHLQQCVDCSERASHWSYNHNDPNEIVSPEGWAYSGNFEYYVPRCAPCHVAFDRDRLVSET